MVKNHFVVDNSDHVLPLSSSNERGSWLVCSIVKVEPTGNAFAATCWVDPETIQNVLSGKSEPRDQFMARGKTSDMDDAIKLAYIESMNRMRNSNRASLYSSLNLFPPSFRKGIGPDYGQQFSGPFASQPPIPHRMPLNTMWRGTIPQQPQPTMRPPAPDQFSKPASFGPGGFRVQPRPTQQQQPEPVPFNPAQDDVETIEVQATPVHPQASFRRPAANHISGMINAILASGNTHGVVASKPNDTVGAFVNGNGEVIITYDDGSISPPIKPESLSIDPFAIEAAMQDDPRNVIPIQVFEKVPLGEPMGDDED